MEDRVATVRAFNRFYTGRIGVLGEGLLNTQHPLTDARVLYDLGQGATDVADLKRELALDAGYLSRVLSRLEDQGLVARERSPDDGRRNRPFWACTPPRIAPWSRTARSWCAR